MRAQLQKLLETRVQQYVSHQRGIDNCTKIANKKASLAKRSAEIVKARSIGKISDTKSNEHTTQVSYTVHNQYLIDQKGYLYLEEEIEQRKADFYRGELISEEEVEISYPIAVEQIASNQKIINFDERASFTYNRLKAVQYAEKWWNSYNPAYQKFTDNCTNYISQCLHQGGGPMRGQPNRSNGWWMAGKNWSYSWTVANALRLYLTNSKVGLRAREVTSPGQLLFGDIICYDFQGNGRFDHNTIVTGKDAFGMPLVNANTTNSRMRYWSYEDSTAYTPNIKYKFFTIVDDR